MKTSSVFAHDRSRMPELGPQVVFFTGGSALRALSRELVKHTHNSVHIITPFDSGGSSAVLRKAFDMPAVGDVRNRLLALADPGKIPAQAVELYNMRLDPAMPHDKAKKILRALIEGSHPYLKCLPAVLGQVLRVHLRYFAARMPADFDLRGASIGNLALAGGYFHHGGLSATIGLFSRILLARGIVLPVVNDNLHLAARLENSDVIVGQHRITGKAAAELPYAVEDLFITQAKPDDGLETALPCRPEIIPLAATLLRSAELICYPMGSFHTSIMANVLPCGVGRAVAEAHCPKLYIPNTGIDPEQRNLSVADQIRRLIDAMNCDFSGGASPRDFLSAVLVDEKSGHYPNGINRKAIEDMGIKVFDVPMVDPQNRQKHLPGPTVAALLEFIS